MLFKNICFSGLRGAATLLLGSWLLTSAPACAQAAPPANAQNPAFAAPRPARLQPLFGGLKPEQAQQQLGAAVLADVDRSFPSRSDASRFFSQKGFEYLSENQIDTAAVRFNLAWALDPKNPDPYRGLAIVLSQRAGTPPEALQTLLAQGLALAPTNASLLTDAGTAALLRYEKSKKKKDLLAAADYLQRATAADPNNATAWQSLARVRYFQQDYAGAWEAVHRGRSLSMVGIDFNFLSELMAKQPDPQGMFK